MASQISPIAITIVLVLSWTAPAAYGAAHEPQALLPQHPPSATKAKLAQPSCRDAASAAPHCGVGDNCLGRKASDMSEEGQSLQKAADRFRFPHKGVIEVRNPVLVDVRCRSPRYPMLSHSCR